MGLNQRLLLHSELVKILGSGNVYFQPGATIKMKYPCIVYKRDGHKSTYAGNLLYHGATRYSITVIDPDPDSETPDKLLRGFPYCSFSAHYAADSLNHDSYTLYY